MNNQLPNEPFVVSCETCKRLQTGHFLICRRVERRPRRLPSQGKTLPQWAPSCRPEAKQPAAMGIWTSHTLCRHPRPPGCRRDSHRRRNESCARNADNKGHGSHQSCLHRIRQHRHQQTFPAQRTNQNRSSQNTAEATPQKRDRNKTCLQRITALKTRSRLEVLRRCNRVGHGLLNDELREMGVQRTRQIGKRQNRQPVVAKRGPCATADCQHARWTLRERDRARPTPRKGPRKDPLQR